MHPEPYHGIDDVHDSSVIAAILKRRHLCEGSSGEDRGDDDSDDDSDSSSGEIDDFCLMPGTQVLRSSSLTCPEILGDPASSTDCTQSASVDSERDFEASYGEEQRRELEEEMAVHIAPSPLPPQATFVAEPAKEIYREPQRLPDYADRQFDGESDEDSLSQGEEPLVTATSSLVSPGVVTTSTSSEDPSFHAASYELESGVIVESPPAHIDSIASTVGTDEVFVEPKRDDSNGSPDSATADFVIIREPASEEFENIGDEEEEAYEDEDEDCSSVEEEGTTDEDGDCSYAESSESNAAISDIEREAVAAQQQYPEQSSSSETEIQHSDADDVEGSAASANYYVGMPSGGKRALHSEGMARMFSVDIDSDHFELCVDPSDEPRPKSPLPPALYDGYDPITGAYRHDAPLYDIEAANKADGEKIDIEQEPVSHLHQEVQDNNQQEMQDDIQQEVQDDNQQEVQDDNQQEVQDDNQQEVQDEIQQEVQDNNQQEVHDEIQQEVQDDIQQEVQDDIQQEVHDDIQQEVHDDNQQEVQDEIQHENQNILQNEYEEFAVRAVATEFIDSILSEVRSSLEQPTDESVPCITITEHLHAKVAQGDYPLAYAPNSTLRRDSLEEDEEKSTSDTNNFDSLDEGRGELVGVDNQSYDSLDEDEDEDEGVGGVVRSGEIREVGKDDDNEEEDNDEMRGIPDQTYSPYTPYTHTQGDNLPEELEINHESVCAAFDDALTQGHVEIGCFADPDDHREDLSPDPQSTEDRRHLDADYPFLIKGIQHRPPDDVDNSSTPSSFAVEVVSVSHDNEIPGDGLFSGYAVSELTTIDEEAGSLCSAAAASESSDSLERAVARTAKRGLHCQRDDDVSISSSLLEFESLECQVSDSCSSSSTGAATGVIKPSASSSGSSRRLSDVSVDCPRDLDAELDADVEEDDEDDDIMQESTDSLDPLHMQNMTSSEYSSSGISSADTVVSCGGDLDTDRAHCVEDGGSSDGEAIAHQHSDSCYCVLRGNQHVVLVADV